MMQKIDLLLKNTGDMALKRRARYIIHNLELKNGLKVLEVGCGDGYYLHLLSNLGLKLNLTGSDFDKIGLDKARKNLGKEITLKSGDLMKKLPFESNSFDRIIMSEVAEHLPNDLKGLKEVKRVLKPGGILCLTVPCANYPFFWDPINWVGEKLFNYHFKSGFLAGIWNQHIRLYKVAKIKRVVEETGFEVGDARSLTWWCLPFNHHIVNIIARLLAMGRLSSDTKSSLSKYTKSPKRAWYLNVAFGLVNMLDRLNDVWQPKNHGVSIFVKAVKPI